LAVEPGNNEAVFVIAEGLLMYLPEADVKALVLALKNNFKVCLTGS